MSYFNGAVLRDLRLRERLSITQVYERTGISRAQISKIETGKVDPKASTVAGLLTCYNASFGDLERSAPVTVDLAMLLERGEAASQRLDRSGVGPSDPQERLNRKARLGLDISAEREALATRA